MNIYGVVSPLRNNISIIFIQDDEDWEEEEDMSTGGIMKNLLGPEFAPAADFPGKVILFLVPCVAYCNMSVRARRYVTQQESVSELRYTT
jgi:hypothetical protein